MTNGEAIEYFKLNISNLKRILDKRPKLKGSDLEKEIQACEKAIENLEQEPTTKNDLVVDCISRQAVIDNAGLSEWFDSSDSYNEFVFALNELPSVTPIRPKGHWIGHRGHCENLGVMPSGLGAYEWCSNCDCGIDVMEWHRNNYNYCPNCGADMREVEE